MTRIPFRVTLLASLASGGLLAGCGGDSNPAPAPPPAASNEVPASAAASDAALEAFAFGLAASDTAEPLMLDNIATLPTSESEEPIALN